MDSEIPLLILNISVTRTWRFLLCIETEPSSSTCDLSIPNNQEFYLLISPVLVFIHSERKKEIREISTFNFSIPAFKVITAFKVSLNLHETKKVFKRF